MRRGLVTCSLPALIILSIVACHDATGPSMGQIRQHRATWAARAPVAYTYEYEITGFFNAIANQLFEIEVRQDTVRAAIVVGTGQPVVGSLTGFPTVEALFDDAEQELQLGNLTAITFDPLFGYPTRMDIAGPPDASGSVFASRLAVSP